MAKWIYKKSNRFKLFLGSMHVFHRSVGMCFYLLFCPRHDWSIVKFYIAWHYLRGMLGWYKCVLFLLSIICNKKALQGILPPGCGEVRQFMFLARRKLMGWFLQINVRCSWWSPHFCWLRRGPEKSWQIHLLASVDTLCETTAPRNRPKPRRKHSSSQLWFSAAKMLLVSG